MSIFSRTIPVVILLPYRHILHVHDRWAVHAEALPEETPRHQRQCLHRLRLPGCCHLFLCARSGTLTHTPTHPHTPHTSCSQALVNCVQHCLMIVGCCRIDFVFVLQVFGRGNMAFWIVFSVIHILATLLLSTQLYYMGRWRLGRITAKNTESRSIKFSLLKRITSSFRFYFYLKCSNIKYFQVKSATAELMF